MKLKYLTSLFFIIPILKIAAQSGYSLELNINTIPTEEITKNDTGIDFSFYKNLDSKNKITNSMSYTNTGFNYNLANFYTENNSSTYNQITNTFELKHQFNQKIALDIEFKTMAGFENSLNFSDVSFFGGVEIDYAFNTKNSLQLGVKKMNVFGKAQVLPTIAFHSQLTTKTQMELGFPYSSIQYSNNRRNTFSVNNVFAGAYYKLDQTKSISPNISASKMSFAQMTTSTTYERNLDRNWYMNFQGGYQFNKKYRLTDNNGTTQFNFNANDGYLFSIGIKYKQ